MMRTVIFAMSFVWLFGLFANAWAQRLQWDAEEQKFAPSPSDTVVVAHFRFKNVGDAEADITAVNSSCSCTKITLDKRKYAPEESGELLATFTIGVRTGVQDKVILVESNDIAKSRAVLRMNVAIPEIAQMRPSFLFWSAGEAVSPKVISFKVMNGFPVNAVTVESSNPAITTKVDAINVGHEYRILVTPSATNQPLTAIVTIKTDYPENNPKTFQANVRVLSKQ